MIFLAIPAPIIKSGFSLAFALYLHQMAVDNLRRLRHLAVHFRRQIGQRPFEMGYRAPTVMIDILNGKAVAPVIYTGLDECTQETADSCIGG